MIEPKFEFESETFYKTVSNYTTGYYAGYYSLCSLPHEYRLEYKLNEITESKKGSIGVLIFDTMDNAKRFCSQATIMECKAVGPIWPVPKVLNLTYMHQNRNQNHRVINVINTRRKSRIKRIDDLNIYESNGYTVVHAPVGTMSARAIKPTRVISVRFVHAGF